jgi:hypothetical protein
LGHTITPERRCQTHCLRNVLVLTRLATADQQQEQTPPALRVVNAVPTTDVDLQPGDTVRQFAMVAGLAVDQAIDAHQAASAACQVQEDVNAVSVRVRTSPPAWRECSPGATGARVLLVRPNVRGDEYIDHGQDHFEERYRQRVLLTLERRAQQLGMTLVPDASAPKAA